nr:DUF1998 domain-containing protein [Ferrimicrobium acidiphilum]
MNLVIPKKVDLRFDDSLDIVYCTDPACGTMDRLKYFKNPPKDRLPLCRVCRKAAVQQAPVVTPQRRISATASYGLIGDPSQTVIRNIGERQIFCPYSRVGDRCNHPQGDGKCVHDFMLKLGSLRMDDPQRPVDSLKRYNPHCPKGLEVPGFPLDRPPRTGTNWYRLDFPRESMTAPLQVSSVEEYSKASDSEVELINAGLKETMPLVFNSNLITLSESKFSRLNVLEATYGYRVGNRFSGVSSYYLDGNDNSVLGRLTDTQGFVLSLGKPFDTRLEEIRQSSFKSEQFENLKEIALHSIKHALLVLVPMMTGLDPDRFYGSYDLLPDGGKVFVYDTDEGGNGGFATLMRDTRSFVSMVKEMRRRLDCPTRECLNACKQCLFIKNCGNVNRKLNRSVLLQLDLFVPS